MKLWYTNNSHVPEGTERYVGITFTPVLPEVLESLILNHLWDVLFEKRIPHVNQTSYQRKVSCAEAIFVTMEAVLQFA